MSATRSTRYEAADKKNGFTCGELWQVLNDDDGTIVKAEVTWRGRIKAVTISGGELRATEEA